MDPAVITAYFLSVVDEWLGEGLTQEQVAQRVGISGPFVSQLRNGRRQIGSEVAAKVAAAMGVTFGEFLVRAERFAAAHPEKVRRRAAVATRDDGLPRLDRIPGYDAIEAAARARAPYLPPAAWEKTRAMSGAALADLTPELLVGFAQTWAQVVAGKLREMPDDGERPPAVKSNANRRK